MMYLPGRRSSGPWWRAFLVGGLLLVWHILTAMAAAADTPPSRLLPSSGFFFDIEYDGLAPHADAWKATAAYDILGRTSTGSIMTDVTSQWLDRLFKFVDAPDRPAVNAELLAIN